MQLYLQKELVWIRSLSSTDIILFTFRLTLDNGDIHRIFILPLTWKYDPKINNFDKNKSNNICGIILFTFRLTLDNGDNHRIFILPLTWEV
jgi:hypothetical protein